MSAPKAAPPAAANAHPLQAQQAKRVERLRQHRIELALAAVRMYESSRVPLVGALVTLMQASVPIPVPLLKAFEDALFAHGSGIADDQAFVRLLGLPGAGTTAAKRLSQFRPALVRELVESLAGEGLPKSDPSVRDETVFHAVGEAMGLSPHTVFDMWKKARRSVGKPARKLSPSEG